MSPLDFLAGSLPPEVSSLLVCLPQAIKKAVRMKMKSGLKILFMS